MSFAFVQLAQSSGAGGIPARSTPNFGSSVTTSNAIIAIGRYSIFSGLTPSFSDTLLNTYAPVEVSYFDGVSNDEGIAVAVAKAIVGGTNAVTINYGTTIPGTVGFETAVMAAEYSGFDTSAPYTASDLAGPNLQTSPGTGTNAVTSTNTPVLSSGAGALISLSYCFGGSGPSAGSGTSRGTGWASSSTPFVLQDQAISSTSAVAATFTATAGTSSHYTVAVYLKNQVLSTVVFRKTLSSIGGRVGSRQS